MITDSTVRGLVDTGETMRVEFKGEERQPLSDGELVLATVCLSNGGGGILLIGVEDDGRVTGARARHGASTDPDRVAALLSNRTMPALGCAVSMHNIDGAEVLAVQVPAAATPVGTIDGRFQRRALRVDGKPECVAYHAHEMLAHEISRGAQDHAAVEVPGASWSDLDPLEFDRLRRLVRQGRGDNALVELSDQDIAKALGVVTANGEIHGIRVGALLLFGREDALRRHIPTHEVAFQVLKGLEVEVNDFVRWPLLRVAEELDARFRARNTEEEIQLGIVRIAIPAIPERSFREAVANALVHRDYTRLGPVAVQWHEDRLEVSSPGAFPAGITLHNLLVAPPTPRSPILADSFRRAGLVERTGRGIDLIFEGQLRYGRRLPDYGRSTAEAVVVSISSGPADLGITRYVAEEAGQGHRLDLSVLLVLNEVYRERRANAARISEVLQVPQSEALSRLNQMVDRGLLESRGERRGRTYHLSAALYRAIGEPAAYVRVHNFEPIQQQQMVMQFVGAHGRITRAQTAELCRLHPRQARRLLKSMVTAGQLRLVGSRRTAYYEAESK